MTLKFTLASIAILISAGSVQALPGNQTQGSWAANQSATSLVHTIGQRKVRRAKMRRRARTSGASGFAANGGTVQDTCTSSNPFYGGDCSPKALTSRCDAAGGGMSSEPGGSVTCDTSGWD